MIEEETNVDFEVAERSTESRDKLTTPVYHTQNQKANDKIQKSSNKITPTVIKKKKKFSIHQNQQHYQEETLQQ